MNIILLHLSLSIISMFDTKINATYLPHEVLKPRGELIRADQENSI